MTRRVFYLVHAQARENAIKAVQEATDGDRVEVCPPRRTTDQNSAQWPILQAFSEQLEWPVNGVMVFMTDEEWKDVLTAAFRREQVRLAMAFDSPGVVMLGQRTSKFTKPEFSDWLEFLHAAAASRGVVVYPDDTHRTAAELVDPKTGELRNEEANP